MAANAAVEFSGGEEGGADPGEGGEGQQGVSNHGRTVAREAGGCQVQQKAQRGPGLSRNNFSLSWIGKPV